jgi:hypothetical protein
MRANGFGEYDDNTCACGCRAKVAHNGLEPRFATTACRTRWVDRLTIGPCGEPESAPERAPAGLDARPQNPPPPPVPVAVEEVAEVQTEFAHRVATAPQLEVLLETPPPGMWVQPRSRSLWQLLTGAVRRVR